MIQGKYYLFSALLKYHQNFVDSKENYYGHTINYQYHILILRSIKLIYDGNLL